VNKFEVETWKILQPVGQGSALDDGVTRRKNNACFDLTRPPIPLQ
jgi:glutaredoxin 2